jgi:Zn-dependent peptidase ImmA (M78 family)
MPSSDGGTVTRVEINPAMYEWARSRARLDSAALERRFPRLHDWERGAAHPTLKQLETYAHATHAPIGFFFLPDPPIERVPIPDFRTMGDAPVADPSADLLDTIYVVQQRQEWFRSYQRSAGEDPLAFVGSVQHGSNIEVAAARIRDEIGFDLDARRRASTWEDALRQFVEQAEDAGVLVMVNGVVLNNTHRVLDPTEFRGFAIADSYAPVVFVNGADTKSGQMFTLAHELAHIWAGQSGVGLPEPRQLDGPPTELWCNRVAAELLVPLSVMRDVFDPEADLALETKRLARRFKVSTLVVLRRIHDVGALSRQDFWDAYDAERDRLIALVGGGSIGGNFHLTEGVRVSRRFARALVASTYAGQTLYRDAFRLLGFRRMDTLQNFGRTLGVAP